MINSYALGPCVNRIEWADVYFTACANREVFSDVTIITAKSEYADLAFQAAADIALKATRSTYPSQHVLHEIASFIMDENKVHSQEHVKVTDNGITVCINAISVEDEDVVWRALDMLADALQHLDGQPGVVYFGDKLYFSSSEIQLSTTH